MQKEQKHAATVTVLTEGIRHFPKSEPLHLCLGISLMNLGEFEKALACFLEFQDSREALGYIAACHQAMGHTKEASYYLEKLHHLEGNPG
jgi:hypothetical protein